MSIESQADKIWQYAMRVNPTDKDMNDASWNVGGDGPSGDDTTTTELSDQFDFMPSKFSFHGLAQSQTQSQGTRLNQEDSSNDPESQKENRHSSIASASLYPICRAASPSALCSGAGPKTAAGTSHCKSPSSSHVTAHVTGASPYVAPFTSPKNASVTAPSGSVPLMNKQGPAPCVAPMIQMTRAVSFPSPKLPPSPPTVSHTTVSHTNTMPPRPNRYAPRDIDRSSQDSFAGSPIPQDLNTYVRNTSVFNNTYIRRGTDGRPGEVFEHPTHVSDTTVSLSEPSFAYEIMSSSQPRREEEEGPSTSQIVRAAFDPRLSPINAPDPVILVRDSPSSHSQSSKDKAGDNSDDGDNSGEASGGVAISSNSSHPQSPQPHPQMSSSSSSVSYELPTDDVADSTQLNTQSTQPNTQPTQTDPQPSVIPLTISTHPDGRSPLPVPPHRRRQIAALQAARLRAKEEIIPETPVSTAGHSVPAASSSVPAVVDVPTILQPRPADARRAPISKAKASEDLHTHTKPSSKGKGKAKQTDPSLQTTTGRPTRCSSGEASHERLDLAFQHQLRQSEVVPDSQEEGQQAIDPGPASSPAVPLIQLLSHRNAEEVLRPPTPTPAAVKSLLRQGQLPAGVTHTRGKGRSSTVKTAKQDKAATAIQLDDPVEEEEEGDQVESQQSFRQPVKRKAKVYSTKVKIERFSKKPKTEGKKTRGRSTTADMPTAGPSTRSRKRKNDTSTESLKDTGVPLAMLAPLKKRQRSILTTPAPTPPVQLDIRVLTRRTDKGNYYFPGTVSVDASDHIPPSTVFTVHFDDGREEDVDVEYMRQFELEPDDVVRVTQRHKGRTRVCSAQVLDVERWDSLEIAEVHELDQGPDADDYDVEGRFLSVSEDRIDDQWNERRVSTRTLLKDKDFDQPARNECLAGMGFIITLPDLPKSKRSLVKLIEVSGGLVYDDWSAIVTLNGTVEVAGKRIMSRTPEMRLGKESRKTVPQVLFCLTDEPRTTPKYLIALALGVPCLSLEWVLDRTSQDDVEKYVDWPAYILPAGYNPVTRMPASQAFDRAWWLQEDNLPKLLTQPPILKPFAGKSFLCVGAPDFLFSKKELGTFPKVILAMGASYVQAVTETARVNVKGPQDFHYTVVDDGEEVIPYGDAVAVNVSWLKKCLVTGIEGPIPWPDREM